MMVKRTMVVTLALAAQVLFGADGELPVGTWQPKFYPGLEAAGNVQTVAKGFKGKFDTIRLAWESGAKTFGVKREVTTDLKGVVDWTVEALVKSEGEAGEVGAAMEFFDAKGQSLGIVRSKRPAYSPEWRRTIWNFTGPKAACRQEIHLLSLDVDPVQLCQMSVKSRQGVDKGELEFDVMALPSEWNRDWNGGDNRMLNFSDAPIPVVFLLKGPGAQREGLQLVVDIPAELEIKDACCPYRKAFEPLKPSATPFVTNGTAFVRYAFEKAKVFEALHVSGYNADESVGIMLTVGPKAGGEKAEKSYRIAYRMVQKGRFGTEKAMTMAFRPLPTGLKLSKNFRVFSWNSSDRHFATDVAALAAFRAYEAAGLATFRKTGNGSRPFARQKELTALLSKRPVKYLFSGRFGDVWIAGAVGIDDAKAKELGVRMAEVCDERERSFARGKMCPEYFINDLKFRAHLRERVHGILADGHVSDGDWVTFDMEPWHSQMWCHCDVCHKAFAAYAGLDHVPTAKEILTPALEDKWASFRCEHNLKSVEVLTTIIREFNPTLKCVDYDYVMPYGDEEGMKARRRRVGKDTQMNEKWLDGHLCSYYHRIDLESFETIRKDTRCLKRSYIPMAAIAGANGYLRPGEVLSPRQVREFALAAFVNGCPGYAFYAGVGYDGEALQAMMEAQDLIARYEDLPWGKTDGTAAPTCANRNFAFASTVRPDGSEVVALFNYDGQDPVEVKLDGKSYTIAPYDVRFVDRVTK